MKDKNKVDTSRRELLKGLTTAAIGGAVVAGTAQVANATETTETVQKPKQTGYRETQHIRDYYESL
ncbi:twin-arginine translocation signal domain-containing protein [Vibrio japonicus]|uniref:Twin-arginine translocation signal domain-containing protein n=1 Tax=Vibrio japonicus TaxID=1824638 RepID=A0ABY5LLI4_9VIBR|nr:twin-arginine translocation signal domain-containing protein [Vibrio japonicus]UUM31755.1 twin-arginine translocation signal domain-containing protein [Vibrio japonicus]